MKILLDTHILLWAMYEPEKLHQKMLLELETQANTVFVSSISIAEIMIKASIGKLDLKDDIITAVIQSGFELIDYPSDAAALLKDLPFHHKDPFDRMLITQAVADKLCLMSIDEKFKNYNVNLFKY